MILTSGRVVPNWILRLAFKIFHEDTSTADLIKDIEDIVQDDLNVTDRSGLSVEDALEVFGKFSEIWPDYEDMLDEFFEEHGLGRDEYDGDDDDEGDDDDDDEQGGPENGVPCEEPGTYREVRK